MRVQTGLQQNERRTGGQWAPAPTNALPRHLLLCPQRATRALETFTHILTDNRVQLILHPCPQRPVVAHRQWVGPFRPLLGVWIAPVC